VKSRISLILSTQNTWFIEHFEDHNGVKNFVVNGGL